MGLTIMEMKTKLHNGGIDLNIWDLTWETVIVDFEKPETVV